MIRYIVVDCDAIKVSFEPTMMYAEMYYYYLSFHVTSGFRIWVKFADPIREWTNIFSHTRKKTY